MVNFCYLVGDEALKACALIDPAFETDRILAEADGLGYRVTHIINTHGHSDHTAGNEAIKAATCETAEAAATAALESLRQHDIDYDAATNHGQTQGARFP